MKIFEITHRINKKGRKIELLTQVIAQDRDSALNKAYQTIPKSYQKYVTTFEAEELINKFDYIVGIPFYSRVHGCMVKVDDYGSMWVGEGYDKLRYSELTDEMIDVLYREWEMYRDQVRQDPKSNSLSI